MKTIFLPIETTSREFDSKITLGVLLASKGYRVVLGQNDFLNLLINVFKPGIYLGKNLFKTHFPTNLSLYQQYKKKGWTLLHLDEEGGIFSGQEDDWKQILKRRIEPEVLAEDDVILTWGEFQSKFYQSLPHSCSIYTTGTPRFALNNGLFKALIEKDSGSIVSKDHVLFNMNFGIVNNVLGNDSIFSVSSKYRDDDTDDFNFKHKFWIEQSKIFTEYLDAIYSLAQREKSINIVVRPHPAESLAIYLKFFKGLDNVKICDSHSALHWINNAKCVIHDGCTTGVEAHLFNKMVINFSPSNDDEFKIKIPNLIGTKAKDKESLIRLVKLAFEKDCNNENNQDYEYSKHVICNFDKGVDSFALIVKLIDNKLINKISSSYNRFKFKFILLKKSLRDFILFYPRYLFPNKIHDLKQANRKFSGFNRSNVLNKLSILNEVQKSNVVFKELNKHCVVLENAKK
jgi:surface carbohydrate biosynthesis protein